VFQGVKKLYKLFSETYVSVRTSVRDSNITSLNTLIHRLFVRIGMNIMKTDISLA